MHNLDELVASIAEIKVALRDSEIPKGFLQSAECKLAVADFLIRRFRQEIGVFARQNCGKDGSGSFNTIALSQKMLNRDSVLFGDEAIYLRFIISLPAKGTGGGVFDAEQAWIMLSQELVAIVGATFFYRNYDDPTRMLLQQFVDVQKIRTEIIRFMRQHELIKKILDAAQEPIKPLYSTVRSLWKKHHISMIFVVGGLGYFLQKADTCLLMENYRCHDITAKVRDRLGSIAEDGKPMPDFTVSRRLAADNFDPTYKNQRLNKTIPKRIKDLRNAPKQLEYGMDLVNLEAVAQLAEAPQILTIGYCLLMLRNKMNLSDKQPETISCWIDRLYDEIAKHGLLVLKPDYPGTLSMPRKYELAAAINRVRSLKIFQE